MDIISLFKYLALNRIGYTNNMYENCLSSDEENTLSYLKNKIYSQLFNNNKWLNMRFNHCACIFIFKNKTIRILCTGHNINYIDNTTLHAEEAAFKKLLNCTEAKQIKINVAVIKITRDGQYRNSKPCVHCLQSMYITSQKKGYKLNKIYYTSDDNTISSNTYLNLLDNNNFHISSYYKNNNFNIDKWYRWRNAILKIK